MDSCRRESKFVFPFMVLEKYKKRFCVSMKLWKKESVETKYLADYIREILSDTNDGICDTYTLKEECWEQVGFPKKGTELELVSRIYDNQSEEVYKLQIQSVRLIYFASRIGFVILHIVHDENESLVNINNKCYALNHLVDRSDVVNVKTDKEWDFSDVAKKMFPASNDESLIEFYNEKASSFHCFEIRRNDFEYIPYIRAVSKGISSFGISDNEDYDKPQNTNWFVEAKSSVAMVYVDDNVDVKQKDFLQKIFPNNVMNYYFYLFILALHERVYLLNYNMEAVKNWKNRKKLMEMRENILDFNVLFSYNVVSEEPNYQNYYDKLYVAFKLEMLEKNIQEVVLKVEEYVNNKKDRLINGILFFISVSSAIPALQSIVEIIIKIFNK